MLVEAAAREDESQSESETPPCCSHSQTKTCCAKPGEPAKSKPQKPKPETPKPDKPLVRWTFGISATSCKGKFGTLMADETHVFGGAWVVVSPDQTLDACIQQFHLHSHVVRLPIDVPPPRSAA